MHSIQCIMVPATLKILFLHKRYHTTRVVRDLHGGDQVLTYHVC